MSDHPLSRTFCGSPVILGKAQVSLPGLRGPSLALLLSLTLFLEFLKMPRSVPPPQALALTFPLPSTFFFFFFKILIYFQRKGGRERNINVWLPLACPLLGTWPATQARALTGNPTSDPLVRRLALHPLSHTSQGPLPRTFYLLPFLAVTSSALPSSVLPALGLPHLVIIWSAC